MTKGLFITLEGPDGSGKTTIAKMLKEYLEEIGVKVALTREPGGTEIGEQIRSIILDNNNDKMSTMTEALLYAAARAQHVDEKIKPLLEEGYVVISDRYVMSSLAYQGHARGLGIEYVMEINEHAIGDLQPDKTLFFDISPEITLKRKFIDREADRLENAGEDFHKTTYEGYQKSIEFLNEIYNNIVKIDANEPIESVFEFCKKEILDTIG